MTKKKPAKTIKQKKFVKEYIKTGNATEAASRAYDVSNRDSARNIGAQNVAKLCISDHLGENGIGEADLFQILAEAIKANKPYKDQSVSDWNVRLKAIDITLKLSGSYNKAEHEVEEARRQEYIRQQSKLTPEQSEAATRMIKKLYLSD